MRACLSLRKHAYTNTWQIVSPKKKKKKKIEDERL